MLAAGGSPICGQALKGQPGGQFAHVEFAVALPAPPLVGPAAALALPLTSASPAWGILHVVIDPEIGEDSKS